VLSTGSRPWLRREHPLRGFTHIPKQWLAALVARADKAGIACITILIIIDGLAPFDRSIRIPIPIRIPMSVGAHLDAGIVIGILIVIDGRAPFLRFPLPSRRHAGCMLRIWTAQ
jgi:hypothetical protein